MILAQSPFLETHYDILCVKEDASYEEIRTSYRSALLNSHPDKVKNGHDEDFKEYFLKVQKAWEVLSISSSRVMYDSELRALRQNAEDADVVGLEDMTFDDSGDVLELYYQCRCGDYFSVDALELGKMGYSLSSKEGEILLRTPDATAASFVLPCGSCSLRIRLLIDANFASSVDDHL